MAGRSDGWLSISLAVLVVGVLCCYVGTGYAASESRGTLFQWEVRKLPGFPGTLPIKLLAGSIYLMEWDPTAPALYYWYTPAEAGASQRDVLFWINGACTSLLGATFEHGPIRVAYDRSSKSKDFPYTVSLNQWRWSQYMHVVYLDASTCTPFSNPGPNCPTEGDASVADSIAKAVTTFMDNTPSLRGARIWLGGEGYSGHIIPRVATMYFDYALDIKGVILGSPTLSQPSLAVSAIETGYAHNTLSPDSYTTIRDNCDPMDVVAALLEANASVSITSPFHGSPRQKLGISIGDQYPHPSSTPLTARQKLTPRLLNVDKCTGALKNWTTGKDGFGYAFAFRHFYVDTCDTKGTVLPSPDGSFDPCAANAAEAWLGTLEVQRAIHAEGPYGNSSAPAVPFQFCSSEVWDSWSTEDKLRDQVPVVRTMIDKLATIGGRLLVISGDSAGLPPYVDAQRWMLSLSLPSSLDWGVWYGDTNDCQVGGYVRVFDSVPGQGGVTLASIRFAGLYAAWDQPHRAAIVLQRFLRGDDRIGAVLPPTIPTSCPDLPTAESQAVSEQRKALRTEAARAQLASRLAQSARQSAEPPKRQGRDGQTPITLPDAPKLTYDQYTGYIHVGGTPGKDARHLFYWFIEASETDPNKAPVLLWLQGGPGCSGLFGMFTEFGPLEAVKNGTKTTLISRDHTASWSANANVLVVEAPVCVGFSYIDGDQSICNKSTDASTVKDNYNFIVGFMAKFPSLAKNDLWITGESYGGHYVPQLVDYILTQNAKPTATLVYLNGMFLGNPLTDVAYDIGASLFRWSNTPIIPLETLESIQKNCTLEMVAGFQAGSCNQGTCDDAQKKAYGISDACWGAIRLVTPGPGQPGNIEFANSIVDVCPVKHPDYQKTARTPYQPCGIPDSTDYLSRPDVQAAIGVVASGRGPWNSCSDPVNINYNFTDVLKSVFPFYRNIFSATPSPPLQKPVVVIFSGDTDEIVPYVGTQNWTEFLGGTVTSKRAGWFLDTNGVQLAGTITAYKNLQFASVRGAGHMVPSYQPQRARALLDRFVSPAKPKSTASEEDVPADYMTPPAGKRWCGLAISPTLMLCNDTP